MMRMTFAVFVTAMMLAGPAPALAQTDPPPPPPPPPTQQTPPQTQTPAQPDPEVPFPADARIGFVNFRVLVDTSALGKAGLQKLQALAKQKETELAPLQNQITTLQQEIQTQGSVLTPQVLQQKQAQLQNLQGQLQLAQQNAQTELGLLESQLLDDFEAKTLPILEALRVEKNLWVILAIQDGGGLAVVAAQPGLNLTPEVARRLDASASGAGGE